MLFNKKYARCGELDKQLDIFNPKEILSKVVYVFFRFNFYKNKIVKDLWNKL